MRSRADPGGGWRTTAVAPRRSSPGEPAREQQAEGEVEARRGRERRVEPRAVDPAKHRAQRRDRERGGAPGEDDRGRVEEDSERRGEAEGQREHAGVERATG